MSFDVSAAALMAAVSHQVLLPPPPASSTFTIRLAVTSTCAPDSRCDDVRLANGRTSLVTVAPAFIVANATSRRLALRLCAPASVAALPLPQDVHGGTLHSIAGTLSDGTCAATSQAFIIVEPGAHVPVLATDPCWGDAAPRLQVALADADRRRSESRRGTSLHENGPQLLVWSAPLCLDVRSRGWSACQARDAVTVDGSAARPAQDVLEALLLLPPQPPDEKPGSSQPLILRAISAVAHEWDLSSCAGRKYNFAHNDGGTLGLGSRVLTLMLPQLSVTAPSFFDVEAASTSSRGSHCVAGSRVAARIIAQPHIGWRPHMRIINLTDFHLVVQQASNNPLGGGDSSNALDASALYSATATMLVPGHAVDWAWADPFNCNTSRRGAPPLSVRLLNSGGDGEWVAARENVGSIQHPSALASAHGYANTQTNRQTGPRGRSLRSGASGAAHRMRDSKRTHFHSLLHFAIGHSVVLEMRYPSAVDATSLTAASSMSDQPQTRLVWVVGHDAGVTVATIFDPARAHGTPSPVMMPQVFSSHTLPTPPVPARQSSTRHDPEAVRATALRIAVTADFSEISAAIVSSSSHSMRSLRYTASRLAAETSPVTSDSHHSVSVAQGATSNLSESPRRIDSTAHLRAALITGHRAAVSASRTHPAATCDDVQSMQRTVVAGATVAVLILRGVRLSWAPNSDASPALAGDRSRFGELNVSRITLLDGRTLNAHLNSSDGNVVFPFVLSHEDPALAAAFAVPQSSTAAPVPAAAGTLHPIPSAPPMSADVSKNMTTVVAAPTHLEPVPTTTVVPNLPARADLDTTTAGSPPPTAASAAARRGPEPTNIRKGAGDDGSTAVSQADLVITMVTHRGSPWHSTMSAVAVPVVLGAAVMAAASSLATPGLFASSSDLRLDVGRVAVRLDADWVAQVLRALAELASAFRAYGEEVIALNAVTANDAIAGSALPPTAEASTRFTHGGHVHGPTTHAVSAASRQRASRSAVRLNGGQLACSDARRSLIRVEPLYVVLPAPPPPQRPLWLVHSLSIAPLHGVTFATSPLTVIPSGLRSRGRTEVAFTPAASWLRPTVFPRLPAPLPIHAPHRRVGPLVVSGNGLELLGALQLAYAAGGDRNLLAGHWFARLLSHDLWTLQLVQPTLQAIRDGVGAIATALATGDVRALAAALQTSVGRALWFGLVVAHGAVAATEATLHVVERMVIGAPSRRMQQLHADASPTHPTIPSHMALDNRAHAADEADIAIPRNSESAHTAPLPQPTSAASGLVAALVALPTALSTAYQSGGVTRLPRGVAGGVVGSLRAPLTGLTAELSRLRSVASGSISAPLSRSGDATARERGVVLRPAAGLPGEPPAWLTWLLGRARGRLYHSAPTSLPASTTRVPHGDVYAASNKLSSTVSADGSASDAIRIATVARHIMQTVLQPTISSSDDSGVGVEQATVMGESDVGGPITAVVDNAVAPPPSDVP